MTINDVALTEKSMAVLLIIIIVIIVLAIAADCAEQKHLQTHRERERECVSVWCIAVVMVVGVACWPVGLVD